MHTAGGSDLWLAECAKQNVEAFVYKGWFLPAVSNYSTVFALCPVTLNRHVFLCAFFEKICGLHRHQICGGNMRKSLELYILWSELSWRKLLPMLATTHYSCPDNAIGLVAECELSWYF